MKKTNYILAIAGFVLFFFLGVQGVSAQNVSLTSDQGVNEQNLEKVLSPLNFVTEAEAAQIMKEEIQTEMQNLEQGPVSEATQAIRIAYYEGVIDAIAVDGATVKESISEAIVDLRNRSLDFANRTSVDYQEIVTHTVDLLTL